MAIEVVGSIRRSSWLLKNEEEERESIPEYSQEVLGT